VEDFCTAVLIKSFKQFLKDREKEKELAAASSTGHEPAQGSDEINSNQSGAIPLQVDTLVS
jgi:hypothetical protein